MTTARGEFFNNIFGLPAGTNEYFGDPDHDEDKCYWVVTEDKSEEVGSPDSEVGTCGPRGCDKSLPTPIQFRLYDDDGELVYVGRAANEASIDYAHDFGAANYGTTRSRIRRGNGKWEEYIS